MQLGYFPRYGFMEHPKVSAVLMDACVRHRLVLDPGDVTYDLGRDSLLATQAGRMGRLSETFFAFLSRNAVAADRHSGSPLGRSWRSVFQIDL